MAFITNYTLSKLAKSLVTSDKITEEIFISHIYQDSRLFSFFTTWELKYLFNYKKLLENEKEHLEYYQKVPETKDTYTYATENDSKLKFHLLESCKFLIKDFRGFIIPPEVKEANLISQFRLWFKENNFAEKYNNGLISSQVIVLKYNREFASKYELKELNEQYNLIDEKPNSGHDEKSLEYFNINEFHKTIEECVEYKRNTLNSYEKRILGKWEGMQYKTDIEIRDKVIDLVGENFFNNYGIQNIKDLWKNYAKVKRGILLKALIEYFKWTYKADSKEFDIITLENFNLSCCEHCKDSDNDIKINNNVKLNKQTFNDDLPF
jgi:hypothetical protein